MLAQGATTLWERWGGYRYFDAGMNSLNHIMFGSVEEFFYRDLAGIAPAGPGYEKVRIRPRVVGDLTDAGATVRTVRGEVRTGWQKVGGALHMEATIPANTTAEIWVPKLGRKQVTLNVNGHTVWAGGNYQEGAEGILSAVEEGDCVKLEAGSGAYCLVVE
jgi:alpha-L-rhamnosidase